jgi:hypothetical protein
VQITAAAAMAANVLDIMTESLPLLVAHTRVSATTTPAAPIYSRGLASQIGGVAQNAIAP